MTFQKTVDLQCRITSWIKKNLRPIKRFNQEYGRSMLLLRYMQWDIPEATHEDFKQAMARAGYFADSQFTNDTYSKVCFNVSSKSVKKLIEKRKESEKWMEGMF